MKRFFALLLAAALMLALTPVSAFAGEGERDLIPIHYVNVINLRAPVAGQTPEYFYTIQMEEGLHCGIVYGYWHDNTLDQDIFVEQTPYILSHTYSAGCLICPDDGYYFAEDCVYCFNGDPMLNDPAMFMPHPYFSGSYYIQSAAMQCVAANAIGDVDSNSAVEAADALLTLRGSLGVVSLTPEQLTLADANGDFACGADDALAIVRYSLGLTGTLAGN